MRDLDQALKEFKIETTDKEKPEFKSITLKIPSLDRMRSSKQSVDDGDIFDDLDSDSELGGQLASAQATDALRKSQIMSNINTSARDILKKY